MIVFIQSRVSGAAATIAMTLRARSGAVACGRVVTVGKHAEALMILIRAWQLRHSPKREEQQPNNRRQRSVGKVENRSLGESLKVMLPERYVDVS